jgi:hypothetical protein
LFFARFIGKQILTKYSFEEQHLSYYPRGLAINLHWSLRKSCIDEIIEKKFHQMQIFLFCVIYLFSSKIIAK